MRHNLPYLTAYWDIRNAGLFLLWCFKVLLLFECYHIVEQDNVFALQPLSDVFIWRASRAFTLLKLDGKLLGSGRVEITPDDQLVIIDALEFLAVRFYLILRWLEHWIDASIGSFHKAKLLVTASVVVQGFGRWCKRAFVSPAVMFDDQLSVFRPLNDLCVAIISCDRSC